MVGVADEGNIDGCGRELCIVVSAEDADHVLQALFARALLDSGDEFARDVDGIYPARWPNLVCKEHREKSASRSDIGDGHAGLWRHRGDDRLSADVHLALFTFKPRAPFAVIGITKLSIDIVL